MSKHKPTAEQIKNDPSLRWCPYRSMEVVFSDAHQTELRFIRYEGQMVRLAELNSIAELPELVQASTIRRSSVMNSTSEWKAVKVRSMEGAAWFAVCRSPYQRVPCTGQDEAEAESHRRNALVGVQ